MHKQTHILEDPTSLVGFIKKNIVVLSCMHQYVLKDPIVGIVSKLIALSEKYHYHSEIFY